MEQRQVPRRDRPNFQAYERLYSSDAFLQGLMACNHQDVVFDDWRELGIPAPTVNIEAFKSYSSNQNRILITLPVAWNLQRTQKDINELLGAIASRAFFQLLLFNDWSWASATRGFAAAHRMA